MKDPQTEAWLAQRRYAFEYVKSIPISSVHLTPEALEQIRLGVPVDQDHVTLMKQALQEGADLPAIVVYRAEQPNMFGVLDGIHRGTAHLDIFRDKIDVYVVDVETQEDVEVIRRTINLKNGKNLDSHARMEQAKFLKLSQGWSTQKAARIYGLSESAVSTSIASDESLVRMVELMAVTNTEVSSLFPIIALARLKEVKRDDLVQAIFHVAKRTQARDGRRLPGTVLEQLAAQAKEAVTDTAAMQLVKRWTVEYPTRKTRGPKEAGILPDEPAIIHRARREARRFITYVDKHLVKPKLPSTQKRAALDLIQWVSTELARKRIDIEHAKITKKENDRRVESPRHRRTSATGRNVSA